MNYLQTAIENAQAGKNHNLNYLAWIINVEQNKVIREVVQQNFWYVDIPRTSSTHIKDLLGTQFGYPFGKTDSIIKDGITKTTSLLLAAHTPAFNMIDLLGDKTWQNIRTFSVVRNPYTWSVSLWLYTKKYASLNFKNGTFSDFLEELSKNFIGEKENRNFFPTHYKQTDYITSLDGKIIVSELLKFEEREFINEYLSEIGVKLISTEKSLETYSDLYNPTDKEKTLVHKIFEDDFDMLGYD